MEFTACALIVGIVHRAGSHRLEIFLLIELSRSELCAPDPGQKESNNTIDESCLKNREVVVLDIHCITVHDKTV